MRILLTNDDGVHAEGLLALKLAMAEVAEVTVVAPDRPRSASGHSITLHKPLRVSNVRLADGSPAMACTGTPSDCVMLALRGLLTFTPDIVFSGINDGPNLGWDLTYSGTVSAAMEACMIGVPSVAMSAVRMDAYPFVKDEPELPFAERQPTDFTVAARFAAHLATVLAEHRIPPFNLLNVNVPSLPGAEMRGVKLTRQGVRQYVGALERQLDPSGKPYYWMGAEKPEDIVEDGTDVAAVHARAISVTPIHLDLTAYPIMDALHQWTHIEAFEG
jgi:5'-nucleotidase